MVEGKRYLDVNVFVYWLGGHPELGGKALSWVKKVEEARRGEYVTSTLTVYEVAVVLSGLVGVTLREVEFIRGVVKALTSLPGLKLVELTKRDLVEALELAGKYGLDYEDALHLAAALRVGAVEIVSNDRDFDRTPLKRVF